VKLAEGEQWHQVILGRSFLRHYPARLRRRHRSGRN
jgi:hypothetical protein